MKILRAALTGCLLMLPALAVAQDVKIDFDKGFNFAPVKTYSIKLGTAWGNDLSQRRVLTEFDEAIAAKGWKKVAEDQADLQVILHGATQTKRNASTFYSGMGGGYGGYRYGGMGMGSSQTVVSEYTVGMLVVDMFEPKTKTLVFRGTAEDEISDNPEKNAKTARKGVHEDVQGLPADGQEVAPGHGHAMPWNYCFGGNRRRRSLTPSRMRASRFLLSESSLICAWATPRQTTSPLALMSRTSEPWFITSRDWVAGTNGGRPHAVVAGRNWPIVCAAPVIDSSR